MRLASDSVSKLTRDFFAKKFVSLSRVLSHWEFVVGADMAAKTQPLKVHYRKAKKEGERPHATLDISATSADSTLLHYQKGLILERLNQIFGENFITDIKFVHDQSFTPLPPSPSKTLKNEDLGRVEELLQDVSDPDLRKRLEKIAQGILRKPITNK
jgi:hypothetical protein